MIKNFIFLFFSIFTFAQNPAQVDFISCDANVSPNTMTKSIEGDVIYTFNVKAIIDTISIDAVNMTFKNVSINNKEVAFKNNNKELLLFEGFKKGKNILTFSYNATPKQTLYFIGEDDDLQIWTQGQGKYTSHWLPSFDDVNEKVIFNICIIHNKRYAAISNGTYSYLALKSSNLSTFNGNGVMESSYYYMQKPMSSYLVMLSIGKWNKQTATTVSKTPLEFYLKVKDNSKFETTYRYTKQIFDFFEKETGTKYPWDIYRQLPITDFLYSGMENTTSTLFSQDFVVDEIGFNDKTYINVNAHELAHQWFGNLITAKSGKHHWLQEGFATYFALLAEKELFGEDHFQWELYEMAERLQQASKTDTIPILNAKASTLTFYQKGAWALHFIRENIGEKAFQKAVKKYLKKHQYKTVETVDFLNEIAKVSDFDTNAFQKEWLGNPKFPINNAIDLLKKNQFIQNYFDLIAMQPVSFEKKQDYFQKIMTSNTFYPLKEEVIYQIAEVPFEDKSALLYQAMATNDLKVRQVIARIMVEIPPSFLASYESLLADDSYITKEIALGTLWKLFPDNQTKYLNQSKAWIGFEDKNLRILWLTLALITKEYELDKKVVFYDELLDYASPKYASTIRQNALTNLLYLNPNDENVMPFLVQATTHHKWQFTLFARNSIRDLIKTGRHKTYFENLLLNLPDNEKIQLQRLLQP